MKKLVKSLLATAAALTLAFAPITAAESQTVGGKVTGMTGAPEGATATFTLDYTDVPAEAITEITSLDNGKAITEALDVKEVKAPEGVKVEDLKLLTKVQDLTVTDENGKTIHPTNVTVTWEVPNLNAAKGKVYVLHYSTVRNVWEVITPSKVNGTEITATFPDLSPVAVVYAPQAASNGGVGTGDTTNTTLYVGIAIVALGVIGAVAYKTKKQ